MFFAFREQIEFIIFYVLIIQKSFVAIRNQVTILAYDNIILPKQKKIMPNLGSTMLDDKTKPHYR